MRICPKCKYVDPPEWRHSRYSYWIDHCESNHFKKLKPKLWKKLMDGETLVEDEDYVYRKTKTGYIERKAKVDYGYQWNIPMENKRALRPSHDELKVWFKSRLNLKGIKKVRGKQKKLA